MDLSRELAETRTESAQVIHMAASGIMRDASGVPVPTPSNTAASGGVPPKAPNKLRPSIDTNSDWENADAGGDAEVEGRCGEGEGGAGRSVRGAGEPGH